MKKVCYMSFAFLFFFFPFFVFADTTTSYFIEANIEENGDMKVKELKMMDGFYNGYLTTLRYRNDSLPVFTGKLEDFEGSSIYNATDLHDLQVYDVEFTAKDFSLLDNPNRQFVVTSSAQKGDYGVYTMDKVSGGADLTIYLPSSYRRASLVSYTLKDVVVLHNDIAEIAWDFIGSDFEEDVENLWIRVNLPSSSDELRVFSHGPLNGTNRIVDSKTVELQYDFLRSGNAVDMRVVFDIDIVPNAVKKSNVNGLDLILEVEQKRANEANALRESQEKRQAIFDIVAKGIKMVFGLWIIGIAFILHKVYVKYYKNRKPKFTAKYLREIPSDMAPTTVSYLLYRKIKQDCFGASILDMIRKKLLIVQTSAQKKKIFQGKNYQLVVPENLNKDTMSEAERILFDLLIDEIGDGKKVTLKEITAYSKKYNTAKKFMLSYESWKSTSQTSIDENFYEDVSGTTLRGILYCLIVPILSLISLVFSLKLGIFYHTNWLAIIGIFYFAFFSRRTVSGKEEYLKWRALYNFLKDFGRMSEKEVPEVALWEKYLVYATVFGIADRVEKAMKIKLQNFSGDYSKNYPDFTTFFYFNHITRNLNRSYVSASQNSINLNTTSSGGGFCGGSSFGGGGFGGGGSGGGRF